MSEEYLIRNCAPTLAGIKTGSLFTCPYSSKAEVISSLRGLNQKLLSKGLRVLPLRFSENRALIYLYRPKRLESDLHQAESVRILQSLGYGCAGSEQCLVHLSRKLRAQEDFPHEIGLFLGYPPGDVCGFMAEPANASAAGKSIPMKPGQSTSLTSIENAPGFTVQPGQREPILSGLQ